MSASPNNPTEFSERDRRLMQRALELAWQGRYSTTPNPRVGCVIAQGGQIIGEGFHYQQGGAHAEVFALAAAGEAARGADVYVTLEPCAHHGATPPCASALVRAGVKRVIAAMRDPNPQVAGRGFEILHNAGVSVHSGLMEAEARALNRGFLSRIERNRPFIRLKCAQSLDGKTALNNGISQWITGEAARHDVQEGRAQSCAILTGVNTVLADNPRLTVREIDTPRQPWRIILDSQLRTPTNSLVVTDTTAPTLLVTLPDTPVPPYPTHIEILRVPADVNGRIDLQQLMSALATRGINEIWTEAGATLNGALLAHSLVDELIIYQAPIILGDSARDSFILPELTRLNQAIPWQLSDSRQIGQDIRLTFQTKSQQPTGQTL